MRELAARIRALFRRSGGEPKKAEMLRCGDLVLDQATHIVTLKGVPVSLTPIEFDLLAILMRFLGRVFTRTELVHSKQPAGRHPPDRPVGAEI